MGNVRRERAVKSVRLCNRRLVSGKGVSGPWENMGRLVQTTEDLGVMAELYWGQLRDDPRDHGVAACGHLSLEATLSHPAEPAAQRTRAGSLARLR